MSRDKVLRLLKSLNSRPREYPKGGPIKGLLNPKNWFVKDFSEEEDFGMAYAKARAAGLKEFMWKGERKSTAYAGTPEQQLKETGITDEQMMPRTAVRERLEGGLRENLGSFYYDGAQYMLPHIAKTIMSPAKTYEPVGDDDAVEQDLFSLYLGQPQKFGSVGLSAYKPTVGKRENKTYYKINEYGNRMPESIESIDRYLEDNTDKKLAHPDTRIPFTDLGLGSHTVTKGKDKRGEYISYYDKWDLNPMKDGNSGDLSMGIGRPFEVYDRVHYKDYGDGGMKRMYFTDDELLNLDPDKKNFDTLALQRELVNRGVSLPLSQRPPGYSRYDEDGQETKTYDGVYGGETKKALIEYQKKLRSKKPNKFQYGGTTMASPLNFLFPTSDITAQYSQMGLNSYFDDPSMLPEGSLGGFFKKIGKAIGKGFGAVGDQTLSFLGMPNVIKNSAYDQGAPQWLQKANSSIGGLATGVLGAAIPGVGLGLGALRTGVNALGGNQPTGMGGQFDMSSLMGGNNAQAYNSGSMLTGLMPNFGQQGFGTQLGQLLGNFGGKGLGGIFGGVNPLGTPGFNQPRMYEEGGQVEQEAPQLVPVQTEVGEYFIHLDGAITKVNAVKKHKQMDDDEVTDIIPEGTYVASDDKDIVMKKKDAEDIIMGVKTQPYKEFKKGMIPENVLFSELFGNAKKMTPAEMTAKVLKMFPTVDKGDDFNKNDIFTELTNQENIAGRTPWLELIIQFNEAKKSKMDADEFQDGGPIPKIPVDAKYRYLHQRDKSPMASGINSIEFEGKQFDKLKDGRWGYMDRELEMKGVLPEDHKLNFFLDSLLEQQGTKQQPKLEYDSSNVLDMDIKHISDLMRANSPIYNTTPRFKKGGEVMRMKDVVTMPKGGVAKYDIGDWIGTAASALPFLTDLFGGNKGSNVDPLARNMILGSAPLYSAGLTQNINAQQNALGQGIQDFTGLGQNLNQYAGMSAGANIMGRQLQQTDFERFNPLTQDSRLANFNTRTPSSFIDAASTPKYDLNALAGTLGPRAFNTFGAQMVGQNMANRNNVAMNQFNSDRNAAFNVLGQRNALDSFSQQFNIGQGEKEMAAKNAQTAGTFGDISSYFNRLGDIQSNILPITTGLNMQRANLEGQIPLGIAQNMMNVGSVYAGLANNQGNQKPVQSGTGNNFQSLRNIIFGSNMNTGNPIGNNFSNIGNMIGQLFGGGQQSNNGGYGYGGTNPDNYCVNGINTVTGMPC